MNRDNATNAAVLRLPKRWPRLIAGAVIVGVLGVAAAIVGFQDPGAAENGKGPILHELPEDYAAQPDPSIREVEWLNGLQMSMYVDPRFGTIARDGDTTTITWFGKPSEPLSALINDAPLNITVALQPADFLPGDRNLDDLGTDFAQALGRPDVPVTQLAAQAHQLLAGRT